jgi:hypothetical protein
MKPASIYFFALSQAPPVLEADTAIWTPLTMAPGKNPSKAFGPKTYPKTNGVIVTYIKWVLPRVQGRPFHSKKL